MPTISGRVAGKSVIWHHCGYFGAKLKNQDFGTSRKCDFGDHISSLESHLSHLKHESVIGPLKDHFVIRWRIFVT